MTDVVWVVESGCYSDRYIEGVYWTIEDVIAAHPVREALVGSRHRSERAGGWQPLGEPNDTGFAEWSNGLDWQDFLSATPVGILGTPPADVSAALAAGSETPLLTPDEETPVEP